MAKEIIGRFAEKDKLSKLLSNDQASFLTVYGRRRVGKTFLVRNYFEKEMVFDLSGERDGNLAKQMTNFFDEYTTRTKGKKEQAIPKNWTEAFNYLHQYALEVGAKRKKIVIFLDEMPWMDTPKSNFISSLEHFWNQKLSKIHNVILVACGSTTSWIQKNLIQSRGGLYNRVTQRIKLEHFSLYETELFYKANKINLSRQIIAELYMVMGGIPHYLKEVTAADSVVKIIDKLCFKKSGLLFTEYGQLFYSLFKNANTHMQIVAALAKHHYGMTQTAIVKATKLPQGSVSKALVELEESNFLFTSVPFAKKKKETLFRLIDNYSLFYNRFIHQAKAKSSWKNFLTSNTYATWKGYAYENICITHAAAITKHLEISGIDHSINSWHKSSDKYHKGAQIDLLIDRADNCITLCEVKYTIGNYTLQKKDVLNLQQKKVVFAEATKSKKQLFTCLITLNTATKNEYYHQEVQHNITLDDLFIKIILE